jgi:hypothetical protein
MVRISRHNSHYVYDAIQSNITCSITAAVARFRSWQKGLSRCGGFRRGSMHR